MELAVCHHYRTPHSEFLAWDASDRDKAIHWHLLQRRTCGRCGTRPEEWDETQGGHRHAYIPDIQRCHGCEQLDSAQQSITGEDGGGVRPVLIRNPGIPQRRR